MKFIFYRIYQFIIKIVSNFVGIHEPKVISGADSVLSISKLLKNNKCKHPLLTTDSVLYSLGFLNEIEDNFKKEGISYSVFYDIVANPTTDNVNKGLNIYNKEKCDSIVVIGGGSAIDCAKCIGALATNKKKTIYSIKGLLKIHKKMPFFVAVPTTAGTGSETTIAAVVVDPQKSHKFTITDPHLIPTYAVLDPKLLVNLPKKNTSTTGMDALTHAVEAYIGNSNTKKTKSAAIESVQLIDKYLYKSYLDGKNIEYRENMQKASYLAGVAFTRAYVGYVHAIAHSLGGKYNVPHGLANAIILPYVLTYYGKKIYKQLANLSDYISLCSKSSSNKEKAEAFISWIKDLNSKMNIPEKFDISYNEHDVNEMIKNALKEGNPQYPVPMIFSFEDFNNIYLKILN